MSGASKKHISYKVVAFMLSFGLIIGGAVGSIYALLNTPLFIEDPGKNMNQGSKEDEDYTINEDYVNFLILGIDKSEHLTDTMMIASLDVKGKRVSVLQIPRDTYVGDDTVITGKINAVYGHPDDGNTNMGGLKELIYDRFKIKIDHYATIDLDAFVEVVDILGGVEVDVQKTIYYSEGMVIEEGKQLLDGKRAEWFVRHRKGYVNADIGRMDAQKQFLNALLDMMFSMSTKEALSIATSCIDKITTDMTLMDVYGYYKVIRKIPKEDIEFFTIPGDGVSTEYNGYAIYGVDTEMLAEILNENFMHNGENLSGDDLNLVDIQTMKNSLYKPTVYYSKNNYDSQDSQENNNEENSSEDDDWQDGDYDQNQDENNSDNSSDYNEENNQDNNEEYTDNQENSSDNNEYSDNQEDNQNRNNTDEYFSDPRD